MLFNRALTLGHVHQRITVKEGEDTLRLLVDSDVTALAGRCKNALSLIEKARKDESVRKEAGVALARAMFGEEQTKKLLEFYGGNELAVLEISARAFTLKLARQIDKAQRKKG